MDDEKAIVDSWSTMFRDAGYVVVGARSVSQAVAECDAHNFDLVVADFIMPDGDGVDLLRQVRARHPLIRSILVSGKLDRDVNEAAVAAVVRGPVECDVYLHKPVRPDRLLAEIERLRTAGPQSTSWREIGRRGEKAAGVSASQAKSLSAKLKRLQTGPKKKK